MQTSRDTGRLAFTLNGRPVEIDPRRLQTTVLDFIRSRGLTGAKDGCAEGACGACAVVMVVPCAERSAYRPINSCLLTLAQAVDQEIYTVEGLATAGEWADAQRVLAAAGGSQCGYCTPGFVMSLFAEQYRPGRVGPCDASALTGNLCRCTGYRPIRDAACALGPPPAGPFLDRLDRPAPTLGPVTADGFWRPATVDECVRLLADYPDAMLVAGGTDLGVDPDLRVRPSAPLVSTEAIDELGEFHDEADRVRIGAGLPLTDLRLRWIRAPRAVGEWLDLFASPTIRNRATLGGNLATASPVGDAAPLLLALDASVTIAGTTGRRAVPLADFFTGYRRTRLQTGEMLVSIDIPKPLPQFIRFYKVAKRRLDDTSTVAAALALDVTSSGRVSRARVAFVGIAATPTRLLEVERALLGQVLSDRTVEQAQRTLGRVLAPIDDHRGSRTYRLEVSRRLIERFLLEHRP